MATTRRNRSGRRAQENDSGWGLGGWYNEADKDRAKRSDAYNLGRRLRGAIRLGSRNCIGATCLGLSALVLIGYLVTGMSSLSILGDPDAQAARKMHPIEAITGADVSTVLQQASRLARNLQSKSTPEQKAQASSQGPIKGAASVAGMRVLIVTPSLAPVDTSNSDAGGSSLAEAMYLQASGAQVTVLHTSGHSGSGSRPPGALGEFSARLSQQTGIQVSQLPAEPIVRGFGGAASVSWRVLRWIREQETLFALKANDQSPLGQARRQDSAWQRWGTGGEEGVRLHNDHHSRNRNSESDGRRWHRRVPLFDSGIRSAHMCNAVDASAAAAGGGTIGDSKSVGVTAAAFDVILFSDSGGVAYYSLSARQSGVALALTPVVVTVEQPTTWKVMRDRLRVSRSDLESDFLERRSLEMADRVIVRSHWMKGYLQTRRFTMPPGTSVIRPLPLPMLGMANALAGRGPPASVAALVRVDEPSVDPRVEAVPQAVKSSSDTPQSTPSVIHGGGGITWDEAISETALWEGLSTKDAMSHAGGIVDSGSDGGKQWWSRGDVTRIVFLGELSAGDGLGTAADAMDVLTADGGARLPLKTTRRLPDVWFVGARGTIGGVAADEFVRMRSALWAAETGIVTHVASTLDEIQTLDLLLERPGTLVVSTGIGSDGPRSLWNALLWGVPVLVAEGGGAAEMIHTGDKPRCVIDAADGTSLARRLEHALAGTIRPCRPNDDASPLQTAIALTELVSSVVTMGRSTAIAASQALADLAARDRDVLDDTTAAAPKADSTSAVSNQPPLVSIIIATASRPMQTARALQWLEQQTFRDFEVIVADDQSAEATEAATAAAGSKSKSDVPAMMLAPSEFGTVAQVVSAYRSLKRWPVSLVEAPSGAGFGSAVRLAVARSAGELLFVCRDGETSNPGELEAMVRAHRMTSAPAVISFEARPASVDQILRKLYVEPNDARGQSDAASDALSDGGEAATLARLAELEDEANTAVVVNRVKDAVQSAETVGKAMKATGSSQSAGGLAGTALTALRNVARGAASEALGMRAKLQRAVARGVASEAAMMAGKSDEAEGIMAEEHEIADEDKEGDEEAALARAEAEAAGLMMPEDATNTNPSATAVVGASTTTRGGAHDSNGEGEIALDVGRAARGGMRAVVRRSKWLMRRLSGRGGIKQARMHGAPSRGYLGGAVSVGMYRSVMGPRRLLVTREAWNRVGGFHALPNAGHEEHQWLMRAALQREAIAVMPIGTFVCHGDGSYDTPEAGGSSTWGGLRLGGVGTASNSNPGRVLREMTGLHIAAMPVLETLPHPELQLLMTLAQLDLASA